MGNNFRKLFKLALTHKSHFENISNFGFSYQNNNFITDF